MILDLLARLVYRLYQRESRKRVVATGIVDADDLQPIYDD